MYLNQAQRARAVDAAVEASDGKPILAGVGDLRTNHVLEHASHADAAGVHALLLAPVSYLPLSDRDFSGLVNALASQSSLPICLYNNPGTTHFTISPELVVSLATLPTVRAVKNPATATPLARSELESLRADLPGDFILGYSGDANIANVLAAGADAWYSVIAGTLPELALQIWAARDEPDKLKRIHTQCQPLWDCFNTWGGIRVVPEICRIIGLGNWNLALPLQPLDVDAVKKIEKVLTDILSV